MEIRIQIEEDMKLISRYYYQDRWNQNKVWEVAKMVGGYYLRQYIKGEQVGRGIKTSKKLIASIGIFEFEEICGTGGYANV